MIKLELLYIVSIYIDIDIPFLLDGRMFNWKVARRENHNNKMSKLDILLRLPVKTLVRLRS